MLAGLSEDTLHAHGVFATANLVPEATVIRAQNRRTGAYSHFTIKEGFVKIAPEADAVV
jgi:hypothetical protein